MDVGCQAALQKPHRQERAKTEARGLPRAEQGVEGRPRHGAGYAILDRPAGSAVRHDPAPDQACIARPYLGVGEGNSEQYACDGVRCRMAGGRKHRVGVYVLQFLSPPGRHAVSLRPGLSSHRPDPPFA
jgi:hypothetical protein